MNVFRYNPRGGTYSTESSVDFPLELTPIATCSLGELAGAIIDTFPRLESLSYYLAALVLGKKTEFPIQINYGYTFWRIRGNEGPLHWRDLNHKVDARFITFSNVLSIAFIRSHEPYKDDPSTSTASVDQYGRDLLAAGAIPMQRSPKTARTTSRILGTLASEPPGAFGHSLSPIAGSRGKS